MEGAFTATLYGCTMIRSCRERRDGKEAQEVGEESSHTKTEGFLEAMVQTINFQLQQESLQFGFVSTRTQKLLDYGST